MAGDGQPGHLLAVAQQKQAAFKEQVTFYQDESRTMPLFSFKARQRLDLGATYDVLDAGGQPIGSFRKDFGKSLLRSTGKLPQRNLSWLPKTWFQTDCEGQCAGGLVEEMAGFGGPKVEDRLDDVSVAA